MNHSTRHSPHVDRLAVNAVVITYPHRQRQPSVLWNAIGLGLALAVITALMLFLGAQ